MANARELLFSLIGKETVSKVAKKAEHALGDLGDGLSETAKDAKRLDAGIADVEKSLKSLASQYAKTGDDKFIGQIRNQEKELRKLKKARTLLGEDDKPDVKPVVMSLAKQLRGGGSQISEALGEGLSAAPLPIQLAVTAAVVAGVAAAAPVIGGMIGGAVTAGLGGGAIALGVASALSDPTIDRANVELGKKFSDVFDSLGDDFKGPVLVAIREISAEVPGIGAELKAAIAPAAKYIEPLVKGFTGLVKNVMPGFGLAIERAKPIFDVISKHLPKIGTALSGMFDDISKNADNGAAGIELMLQFLEGAIVVTGKFVGFLTDALDISLKLAFVAGQIGDKYLGWLPGVGGIIRGFNQNMTEAIHTTTGLDGTTSTWTARVAKAAVEIGKAGTTTDEMRQRQKLLNGSMQDAIDLAGGLSEAFDILNGKALDSREAESRYQEAIDNVTASVKENGHTLDLTNDKGRANDQTVRALIDSIDAKAQATYNETLATKGAEAAQAAATTVYEGGRQQLIKSLTQILGNKEAAKRLADEIMKIPKKWSTAVTADTSQAEKAAKALVSRINSMHARINVSAALTTSYGGSAHSGEGYSTGMSGGGEVTGPGPKGVDSERRLLAPGEYVLDTGDVDALGGPRAVDALRKSLGRGQAPMPTVMPSRQSGGMSMGGGMVPRFEVVGERELVALFRRMIKQFDLVRA